ncbi:MAG: hypothetical protein GWP14_00310 [Actinobacteria bacterium]|nr:hypothetical protein [Actinomycetota bacterium]
MKRDYKLLQVCEKVAVLGFLLLMPHCVFGANLITNGNFERGAVGAAPVGWKPSVWAGGNRNSGKFSIKLSTDVQAGCGRKCLQITGSELGEDNGKEICRGGVWSKPFFLQPDTQYEISFFYRTDITKTQQGYAPAWISIGGNVSVEWRENWLADTGGTWKMVTGVFHHIGAREKVKILLRNNAEGDVWFDEVIVRPAGQAKTVTVHGKKYAVAEHKEDHEMTPLTDEDLNRQYVVFNRAVNPGAIYPTSYPAPGEKIDQLRTFATPGEYEPVSFTIFPLKDLANVKVEVTDLIDPSGKILSKDCIDIRSVKSWIQGVGRGYMVVPELLEEAIPLDLKTRVSQQYWLTFHIPEDASAGRYKGSITITAENAPSAKIDLGMRILPFTLDGEIPYAVGYYADISAMGPHHPTNRYSWEEIEVRLRDMKDHGMNCLVYSYPDSSWDIELMGVRGSKEVNLDFSVDNRVIDIYKKSGFTGPIIVDLSRLSNRLAGFLGLNYPSSYYRGGSRGDTLLLLEDQAPPEFVKGFKDAIKQMWQNARENDWPELIYYPIDEPAYQGERTIKASILQYKWIKEAVPEARTLCPVKPKGFPLDEKEKLFRRMGPYLDIRTGQLWGTEESKQNQMLIDEGVYQEMWMVLGPANSELNAYVSARDCSGFKLRKTGMTGITYWTYGQMGQNDGKGGKLGIKDGKWDEYIDIPGKFIAVSYRSPRNPIVPVPTLAWEGVREGVDDLKYVATLERLIAQAKKSDVQETKDKAAAAEKMLESIISEIPWTMASIDWWETSETEVLPDTQMNKFRWKICLKIMELSL